jgi:hypothetical protein
VITEGLHQFILEALPSVSHLEAVLLFHARPGRALDAAEVGSALYLVPQAAEGVLAGLQGAGVLRALDRHDGPPRVRYAPADAGLARLVDELAAAHATRLVELTTLIHRAHGR